MWYKILGVEGLETFQEEENRLELVQLINNITFQNEVSKYSMLVLVEAYRNLMLCFHNNTISVDNYTS